MKQIENIAPDKATIEGKPKKNGIADAQSAFFAALVAPWTVSLMGCLLYMSNSAEMPGSTPALLIIATVFILVGTGTLFLIQLPFFARHCFHFVNTAVFATGFLLWFQANIFNWNFGELDGRYFHWYSYKYLGIFEFFCLFSLFCLALWQSRRISRYVGILTTLIVSAQLISLVPFMIDEFRQTAAIPLTEADLPHAPTKPTWKQYEVAFDELFHVSKERNVILIILDSFSPCLFREQMEEYSDTVEIFKDFVYYPNAINEDTGTQRNVPKILTGCDLTGFGLGSVSPAGYAKFLYSVFHRKGTLLKTLASENYRCDLYASRYPHYYMNSQWVSNIRPVSANKKRSVLGKLLRAGITDVCQLLAIRLSPILVKPYASMYTGRMVRFAEASEEAAYRGEKFLDTKFRYLDTEFVDVLRKHPFSTINHPNVFKCYHLSGPHKPTIFNENFEYENMPDITGEQRQSRASLLLTREILRQLRDLGVYDQSMIIVMGDHGKSDLACVAAASLSDMHQSLFLIKQFHAVGDVLEQNDTYVNVRDVTPTILGEIGLSARYASHTHSRSVFDVSDEDHRIRKEEYERLWAEKAAENNRLNQITAVLYENAKAGKEYAYLVLPRDKIKNSNGNLRFSVGNSYSRTQRGQGAIPERVAIVLTSADKPDENYWAHASNIVTPQAVRCWICTALVNVSNIPTGNYRISFLLDDCYKFEHKAAVSIQNGQIVQIVQILNPPSDFACSRDENSEY